MGYRKSATWLYRDFRFWMIVISLLLLLWMSAKQ